MNFALEIFLWIFSGMAGIVVGFIICYKLFIGSSPSINKASLEAEDE